MNTFFALNTWTPYDNFLPYTVLHLGLEDRGVLDRALFVRPYKNEGNMCHVMCLVHVSRHVTKYDPIPQ